MCVCIKHVCGLCLCEAMECAEYVECWCVSRNCATDRPMRSLTFPSTSVWTGLNRERKDGASSGALAHGYADDFVYVFMCETLGVHASTHVSLNSFPNRYTDACRGCGCARQPVGNDDGGHDAGEGHWSRAQTRANT